VKPEELVERYYDGEAGEAEAERVRELLASDAKSREQFERLGLIGSLVREAEGGRRLPANFTDRLMERIAAEAPPRRRKRAAVFAAATASALALAALVTLWVRVKPPSGADSSSAPVAEISAPSSAPSFGEVAVTEPVGLPVAIESVDFGSTQGAIFLVSAGVTDTMVVWTLDEPVPHGKSR
jgi:negative regulator of sigma E activity